MTLIDEIVERVAALPITGGELVISRMSLATPPTDAFFTTVLQTSELRITGAARTVGQGQVMVSGKADIRSYHGVDVAVTFTSDDRGVICRIEGTQADDSHAIPLIDWITLRRVGMAADLLEFHNVVLVSFLADLALSDRPDHVIPIRFGEVGAGHWQITVAGEGQPELSAADAVKLMAGHPLISFLPQQLVEALDGLRITDLSALLDLEQQRIRAFSIAIDVCNGWQDMLPGFGLEPGLRIGLSLRDPDDPVARELTSAVHGTLRIGATLVPVFARMVISAGPTSWSFGLDPDPQKYHGGMVGVRLGTLADLTALASAPCGNALPAGLSSLPTIDVTALQVAFTTSPAELRALTFAAETASVWDIVPGFLAIRQLAMALDITRPSAGTELLATGWVAGRFAVSGSAELVLRVEKGSAGRWSVSGGLPPGQGCSLKELAATLLRNHVCLPASTLDPVFTEVTASAVIGTSFALRAGSTTPWKLLAGLSLEQFQLCVSYGEGGFSGRLATTIAIAGTALELGAALDHSGGTGWSFEGVTQPGAVLGIGALITDIGHHFGVALPEALSSLTLSNLRLTVAESAAQGESAFTFTFGGEGHFLIAGVALGAEVTIQVTRTAEGAECDVTGHLVISKAPERPAARLEVAFSWKQNDASISVDWAAGAGQELTVAELADALGFGGSPDLPEALAEVALSKLSFGYDFAAAGTSTLAVELTTAAGDGAPCLESVFLRSQATAPGASSVSACGLALTIRTGIRLSRLPVVGSMIPHAEELGIDSVSVWALTADAAKFRAGWNTKLEAANLQPLGEKESRSPVVLAGDLDLGPGGPVHLSLPLGAGSRPSSVALHAASPAAAALPSGAALHGAPAPVAPVSAGPTSSDVAGVTWTEIHKQFGPFRFERVAAAYQDGKLRLGLDASVALGPMALAIDGLTVASPLQSFSPVFDISGLSAGLRRGGLEISGALEKVGERDQPSFYGEITVNAASFGLRAIGGYRPASAKVPASFFIYANAKIPLGGPPFLFITGFAGGFGVNRSLVLPTIDTLPGYVLLPANAPELSGKPRDAIGPVIERMQAVLHDEPGQYWVAAGISFTSFEMIEAFALVTVAFGVETQVGLLGSCAMTFPKGQRTDTVAYLEIDMAASFIPSSGLLAIAGVLTPASSLYGGLVHLSGGFAFSTWFSGPRRGEFVVSIGGYHPAFRTPGHYPAVPQLRMEFSLGPLHVMGRAYFALTPAVMMAGLAMRATWNAGGIRAWLDVQIDFLIAWAPVHYEARAHVQLGCTVRIGLVTVEAQVGTDLLVWGPAFGGRIDVDLGVLSFSIAFGAGPALPPPVGWRAFREGFLPRGTPPAPARRCAATANVLPGPGPVRAGPHGDDSGADAAGAQATQNVLKATVTSGLRPRTAPQTDWIVDPDSFVIDTASAIPANHAEVPASDGAIAELPNSAQAYGVRATAGRPNLSLVPGTRALPGDRVWTQELGLRPMKLQNVQSYHRVELRGASTGAPVTDIEVQPILMDVPAALYADTPPSQDPNERPLVPQALVGLRISRAPRHAETVRNVPLGQLLYVPGHETGFTLAPPAVETGYRLTVRRPAEDRLDITVSGATSRVLPGGGHVLAAVDDAWVRERRADLLDAVRAAGFPTRTREQIDVGALSRSTVLTAWPTVALLGGRPVAVDPPQARARKGR